MPVSVVLFDFGGVLARFDGASAMRQLTGIDDDDELWRRWLTCPWVRGFESGATTADVFATGFLADWAIESSAAEFLEAFAGWAVGVLPGAEELVTEVRAACRVALLSNTNALHWTGRADSWRIATMFDEVFLSFQIGMLKPDPGVYDHVVTSLGVRPDDVLFLDDNALNVDAAAVAGLRAHRVCGVDEARQALESAGVLSSAGDSRSSAE